MIYSDQKSTLIELLEKNNSVSMHKQNLRFLVIEMFKFKGGFALHYVMKLFYKTDKVGTNCEIMLILLLHWELYSQMPRVTYVPKFGKFCQLR